MARIRTIKPEYWEDEVIGALSLGARLLFIATWNYADDEGLIRWSAPHLKSVAFRYDNNIHTDNVEAWMSEIEQAGLVFTYSTARDRGRLAFIVHFRRHQRIDKPQEAKLSPPNWRDPVVVEMYARRTEWICPVCKDPLDGEFHSEFHSDLTPKSVPGLVAERIKTLKDDPTNIHVVHARCARNAQVVALPRQRVDEFQEPSQNDPGLFPDPSATDMDGKGYGRDEEPYMDGKGAAPKRGRPKRPQTEAPNDFEISSALAEAASDEHGFDRARLELEKKKFLNHHRAKDNKYSDWTHAFRNWLIKAKEFDDSNSRAGARRGHQAFQNSTDPNAYDGEF